LLTDGAALTGLRELELAYRRTVGDWQATTSTKGASATPRNALV